MKNYFLISLVFIPFYLFAQGKENSVKRIYYRDSILAIERLYGNDKKLIRIKTFYKSGELNEDFHYKNGYYNGLSYKYNKSGKKVTIWRFEKGKLIERKDPILEFNKKDEEKIKTIHEKLKHLNNKLSENPNDFKLQLRRAHIRQLLGNNTLALHDFSKIESKLLKLSKEKKINVPNKLLANIYDSKASIYGEYEMKNYATQYKYKALKCNPEDKRLIYNLGSYLYSIKSYRLAEYYLKKALEKRPDHEFSHRALAGLYTDFEDYKKALDHVNLAFMQESNLIKYGTGGVERDIRTLRGFIYHKLGQSDKGITDLKEAIKLNENNSFAYRNLGVVYHDLGNYTKACKLLQKAKQLGYEKTHDRYDLQNYLEFACKNAEVIQTETPSVKNSGLINKPYIYPNPTKDIINIKNLSFENYNYLIFDYAGKLITQGNSNTNNSINMSNLPTGVYILKAHNKNAVETFRIIKE
ncbi:T9SS type A sorting domain-containing protein [Mariniflexile litorale]|uniref:T9SS type A sorting domain-containing protein n=1 Tax=Mariniflexile litorale TaxID=3045158 RepID=A0AAU7EDD5_9FLAO|nr:T9SS type A sorting domain-containing protein [Mariniflexile sp. KMM 9835]MDQ8212611.1 T9SS type A sorting domain-containing protein [Mariniflexile sp. KMM 9835]